MSPAKPAEGTPQREILLLLRASIDTAIAWPQQPNVEAALSLVQRYPRAMRSSHITTNLGPRRWDWLNERGIYPIGEPTEIAGSAAIKATITPEVTK
jgi:hypothetical protein